MVPVKNWRCNNARGLGAPWQKLTAAQQGCKGQFASSDGPFAYRERNKSSNGVELQRSSVWLNFSIFSQEQPPSLFLNRTENFLNIRWVSKEKLNLPSPSKEQHFFFLPFLANKTRIRYLRKIDRISPHFISTPCRIYLSIWKVQRKRSSNKEAFGWSRHRCLRQWGSRSMLP